MQRKESFLSTDECSLLNSYKKEIDSIQISFNRLKAMTAKMEKLLLETSRQTKTKDLTIREEKLNDMIRFDNEEDDDDENSTGVMTASEFSLRPCGNILYDSDDEASRTTQRSIKAAFFSPVADPPSALRNQGLRESLFSYSDLYKVDPFDSQRLRLDSTDNAPHSKRALVESSKFEKSRGGNSVIKRKLAKARKRIARAFSKMK